MVSHGKQDCEPLLVLLPVLLEDIALNQCPTSILEFKEVLDDPIDAGIVRGVVDSPGKRFDEVVSADLDV